MREQVETANHCDASFLLVRALAWLELLLGLLGIWDLESSVDEPGRQESEGSDPTVQSYLTINLQSPISLPVLRHNSTPYHIYSFQISTKNQLTSITKFPIQKNRP
jgi:hypothetical protein